jgi:hypothetical protein
MPHFLRDAIIPSAVRLLWNAATVELRERCLRQALAGTKTKWTKEQVRRIAERSWDELT